VKNTGVAFPGTALKSPKVKNNALRLLFLPVDVTRNRKWHDLSP